MPGPTSCRAYWVGSGLQTPRSIRLVELGGEHAIDALIVMKRQAELLFEIVPAMRRAAGGLAHLLHGR